MSSWRLLLSAILFAPGATLAAALRLCTDVQPHPPYLTPDGGGLIGRLVSQAARDAGVALSYRPASLARCRAEVALGTVHGFPMAPYMPAALPFARYPMRDGLPDASRAVAQLRIMLYRRRGAAVSWDGKRIEGLRRPVLIAAGSVAIQDKLDALQVATDNNARSIDVNFAKIMAGRGELTAGFEEEGKRLLRLPQYAGNIEMLPQPLQEGTYYLVVSRSFYAGNDAAVEKLWDAIGRLNQAAKTQKE